MKLLSHIGDIFAIPFFALMIFYFYVIENRTTLENILFIFSIFGLIFDIFFTYLFLFTHNKSLKKDYDR